MATGIGTVKALIGTAIATAVDGSQRNLLVGDSVYADEIITTGDTSAIEIEFADGSLMDLGRNSQAFLDTDIFDPQQVITPDSDVEITALQDALLDGEDPTQQGEATAAGAESEGNEGSTTVVVEHENLTVEVTSGFETSAAASSFLDDSSLFGGISDNTNNANAIAATIAPPTAVPISTQSDNDSDVINFNISGNFSGSGLTFSASGLPNNLSINPITGIISGTLDSSASQSGPYNATIIATDTAGGTVSQSFVWDISNPAPEADNDSASLNEDSTHNGSVASNDNDPDGDVVNFSLNTSTSNGALLFNNDGSYTYTPIANFNGTDSFSYTITDADGATDTATVTLTVNPIDDPTTTVADIGSTNEDTTLSVNAANGVLSNDSDIDDVLSVATFQIAGDTATYSANTTATITGVGTLTINADGSYTFVPTANYDGAVPVASYTTNTGATDTLTISITGINDAPVANAVAGTFNEDKLSEPAVPQTGSENLLDGLSDVDDITGHVIGTVSDDGSSYQTIASNGSTQIKVEFSYQDKNGDPQTIHIPVRVDADGEYHVSQSALLDAIPEGNSATGSFFYQIDDTHAVNNLSAPQEFTITINGENDAPEFNVTSLANEGDIPVIVKLSGDSYNIGGQDAPRFIVSVDGVALNGGNALTVEELRSYRIDNSLGSEPQQTSWEYVTFNVPSGTSSVAIRFVGDAWEGGSDRDGDGYTEDRNLIIDYVNVGGNITTDGSGNVTVSGGTTLQAEDPSVSTYTVGASDRSGRETMPWAGTMTFNVTDAVNNATPTHAFQTENFVENTVSGLASVTGTVSLLEGVSDIDDVVNVITVGTVNGNAGTVGTPFNLDLQYDDGSGPQTITVQVTVAADGSYQLTNTAALDPLPVGITASGTFQFQAQDDSNDLSAPQTFTINVVGTSNAPVITQALDSNTVTGTHESATSLIIFIKDLAGNIISQHEANVNADGTWSADFTKPAVSDYTMTAIAYDGLNGTGNASDVSNAINVNVGSTYQNIVDADDAINIVFDGAGSNSISTGAGDDVLVVGRGNDTFNAGDGDDKFIVEGFNKGSNQFNGGAGTDTIQGGDGNDRIGLSSFNASNSIELIDGGAGTNFIQGATYANLDFSATTLANINEVRDGAGSNTITGNDQDITYRVGRGNDTFNTGAGDDTFLVANNSGTNQFNGGAGTDTIQAEEGVDSVIKISSTSSIEIIDGGLASDFNVLQGATYSNLDLTSYSQLLNIDEIRDGAGSNTITGRDENTTYRVGRGNDTFNAGSGDDTFLVEGTNKGSNQFNGGAGTDTIQGGAGNDIIGLASFNASNSIEVIDGGAGNNVIQGATYANLDFSTTTLVNINEIRDGAGSNTITGNDQDTNYRVGRGNDTFNAGSGDDTFIVEGTNKGSNQFNGGAGIDTIQGGAGDDRIGLSSFNASNSIEVIDGGAGNNVIQGATYANLDFSTTTLVNINEIRDGAGSNTITGNDQDTDYRVGRGNDIFNAGSGDDTFIVEGTNKGSNTFNGGAGTDTIQGGAGNDEIRLSNFDASNSIEVIDGGAGNNVIKVVSATDLDLSATTVLNIDQIIGGNSSNTIIGSQGDDSIDAGRGSDIITGGSGNDILTGGTGNDLFIWNSADVGIAGTPAHDQVTDFTGNTSNSGIGARDILDLSDLLSNGSHTIEGLAENDASGPGQHLQLSIKDAATNSVVQTIDLNNIAVNFGDNTADMLNNLLANGGIDDGI